MNDEVMDAGAEAPANDTTPAQVQETQFNEPSTTESGEFDLRAELEKAFDKHTGSDKPRDEHGRWTKADGSTEDAPEPETDTPVEASEDTGTETPVESDQPNEEAAKPAERPAIDPPISWSREAKEHWASIPPAAQEIISKRESEAHSHIAEMGRQLQHFAPIQQVLETHAAAFRAKNLTPDQGIAQLLNVQDQLDRDPYGFIPKIAQAYGVDLSVYANASGLEDGTAMTPELAQALHQNQLMQQRLDRLEQETAQRQQREAEIQQQTVASEIDAFLASNPVSDEQMQELAEYVGYLTQTQPHLSTKDRLATAYKRIVAENPRVVEERLKAQQAAEVAKKAEEAKKKASEAKKVAHLNVKSSPANTAPRKFKSLEEEVAWAYDNRAAG